MYLPCRHRDLSNLDLPYIHGFLSHLICDSILYNNRNVYIPFAITEVLYIQIEVNILEIRRLVKSGAASHTISLPKNWLDKNKLNKGDILYINEKSDRELTL